MVRTTLEYQGSAEMPEGKRVVGMPSWQEGDERITSYLIVPGLQLRRRKYSHEIKYSALFDAVNFMIWAGQITLPTI